MSAVWQMERGDRPLSLFRLGLSAPARRLSNYSTLTNEWGANKSYQRHTGATAGNTITYPEVIDESVFRLIDAVVVVDV